MTPKPYLHFGSRLRLHSVQQVMHSRQNANFASGDKREHLSHTYHTKLSLYCARCLKICLLRPVSAEEASEENYAIFQIIVVQNFRTHGLMRVAPQKPSATCITIQRREGRKFCLQSEK